MRITGEDRRSQLNTCLAAAHHFLLTPSNAIDIIQHQIDVIKNNWDDVCDLAHLNPAEKNLFWGKQFLNPYAFLDLPERLIKT